MATDKFRSAQEHVIDAIKINKYKQTDTAF